MIENLSVSFQGIWSHKLRSLLTMLGIIIGIASIISIVSNIKGTNDQIKENLIGAGNNIVTVSLYKDGYEYDLQYEGLPYGVSPVSEEVRAQLDELDGVREATAFNFRRYSESVYFRTNAYTGGLYGIDSHYLGVYGFRVIAGRAFTENDYKRHKNVAVIEASTSEKLLQGESPVGATVEINGVPFVIVGVVSRPENTSVKIETMQDYLTYSGNNAGMLFIPDAAWANVYRYDEPQTVAVRANTTDDMTDAGRNTLEKLNELVVKNSVFEYKAQNIMEQAADMQKLANSTNNQLVWIAGISLLVGGIGVMNIMMVSVTERTKEIGLKKAIGARRKRILSQFLTEASVLTGIGGVLGVIAGIGLSRMMAYAMETPTAVSVPSCILAVAFSTLIGMVFGFFPALKASRLNPIDALNHE